MKRNLYIKKGFITAFVLVFFINISAFLLMILHKCYVGYSVLNNLKEFDNHFKQEIDQVLILKKHHQKLKTSEEFTFEINGLVYQVVLKEGEIIDYWID